MPEPGPMTSKRSRHLRVPVLPEEESDIKSSAQAAGLPVAAYLRNVALGYRVTGILDNRRVEELVRVNADLGRLGGLLKLWLTNDERTLHFGEPTIRAVLSKIEDTQAQLQDLIRSIVLPRSHR